MISYKVTSGKAEIHVRLDGDKALPALLLSNSLATDNTLWDSQVAALTQFRHVIRYDTRGHGQSSAPYGPYFFHDLVDDMIAILDHLGIETADILGLSIGGMTALGIGLSHPERVRKVVCACARAEFPAPAIATWDQRIAAAKAVGVATLADETLGRWFTPDFHKRHPETITRVRKMIEATSLEGYVGCAEALKRLDYFKDLPTLSRPTLFIAAAEDAAAPPAVMKAMADATPDAKFVAIPNASHIANIENAPAFNTAVQSFLVART